MAVYPCDYSRHRYRQPQQSLYYTEISEHLVSSYLVRLCPQHFDEVRQLLEENMKSLDDDLQDQDACEQCDGPRLFTVQARLYPKKSEEVQLITDLCAGHASELGNAARVYNGRHLADR